jgi:hypothetical protein
MGVAMINFYKKLLVLIPIFIGNAAYAGYSVDSYLENKSNELMQMYVFGVANGYLNSNVYMRKTEVGPIFCPNLQKNLILSKLRLPDFLKILDAEISKESPGATKNIEVLLLQGMLNELKCENKK